MMHDVQQTPGHFDKVLRCMHQCLIGLRDPAFACVLREVQTNILDEVSSSLGGSGNEALASASAFASRKITTT